VRSRRQELGLRLGHADEGSRVAATAVFVQKEAPSAGPDIWAGYAANSRPNPPIQVERGEPFGLDHVSGHRRHPGQGGRTATGVVPAGPPRLALPYRRPLCRSSELEKACPGADGLSGTCIYSSGTARQTCHLLHQQHSNGQRWTRKDSNEWNFREPDRLPDRLS
jgi:hypothetical protein